MNSLYRQVLIALSEGKKISVNLKNKGLIVNHEHWLINGQLTKSAPTEVIIPPRIDCLSEIEILYHNYKYSYPDEKETKRKRNYFKALSYEELTDEELVNGKDRYNTRISLEAYIVCCISAGYLKWKEEWGSWYYQGKDKDLIILREWIE